MGLMLDKPVTDMHTTSGTCGQLRYAATSMQGWRTEMEDAHCVACNLHKDLPGWALFGVFDGHLGSDVATNLATLMPARMFGNNALDPRTLVTLEQRWDTHALCEYVSETLVRVFLALDDEMRYLAGDSATKVSADTSGADTQCAGERETGATTPHTAASFSCQAGSTAVCALVSPTHVYLVNCGDSRAVYCFKDETSTPLPGPLPAHSEEACTRIDVRATRDHKPHLDAERSRILSAGCTVQMDRVNGVLSLSRALGDYEYKQAPGLAAWQQAVTAVPDTFTYRRNLLTEEFLLLACDGVWDVYSSEHLCWFVRSRLRVLSSLQAVVESVVSTCLHKGSQDNITVVLVVFPSAPTVTDLHVQLENNMRASLLKAVEEYVNEQKSRYSSATNDLVDRISPPPGNKVDVESLTKFIMNKSIANLPVCGGIPSVLDFLIDAVHKFEA